MAENVNANININIDTSDAVAQLRLLQSQIATFNKALVASNAAAMTAQKNMVNTLVAQIGATHQFSTSVTNVETSVSRLGKAIDKNKLSLGEYFKYGMAASSRFGRMFNKQQEEITNLAVDRVKRLQTQYIALERAQGGMTKALAVRPLQLFNADTAIAIQKSQLFNKLLHDGSTSLINWGKNTQWAGRQLMVGFTVPLTIFGGMAGKIFMDLEKQVVKFRRVYGDATTPLAETDAMIGQIQELAKEYTKYGIAVSDTIALAGDAAAAGAQGESLIAATAQATRLGTLGMIDQQQALTATIALQSAFRLSNEELANSVNFLNAVENQTVVSLDDITQAIPIVAPVIQGLGGDVQDLAIFMAAMREGGVNASEGANALKSGLASLINPTKAAREQLSAVNIDIDSILSKNRGDLRGIVTEFGAALGTLDKFQRQQVLAKMFGKYQFARLGALFDNINRSGSQASRVLDLTSTSVEELGALADKELGAISESVGVKFTASVERFKLAIAPIGETFLRIATPIVDFATKIAEKFNELSPTAKQFTVILVAALGVVVPTLVMVTGLFANFFGQIIKGLATFKNFFSRITGGASALDYLSEQELDAAAASATLEGKVDSLTSSLNVQKAAVKGLARAYGGYIAAAQTAATNLPSGAIRTPRPRRMATGGFVAGTGNKDTEPALLTPGEFVVNKDAAQRFGPILGAMNNGTIKQLAEGTRTRRTSNKKQVTVPGAFQSAHFALSRDLSIDELMALLPNVSQSVQQSIRDSIAAGRTVLGYTNEVVQVSDALNAALNNNMANVGMVRQDLITNAKFSHQEFVMQLQRAGATPAQINQAIDDITNHIATQLSGIADDIVITETQFAQIVGDAYDSVALAGDNAVLAARSEMASITTIGDPTGRDKGQRIALTGRGSYRGRRESYKSRMVATSQATGMQIPYGLTGAFNIAPMAARLRIDAEVMADIWKELSVETRAYLATIKSDITRFNEQFVIEAERMGINIGNALNFGASTAVGANSPATDGIRLVDNYVAGMEIGAAQNIGEARAAGTQVRTAFNQGTMSGGPITQSGMTFLPSPMGLFLPQGFGGGPGGQEDLGTADDLMQGISEGVAGKPGADGEDADKIKETGKQAKIADENVGKFGKTLGRVGKGVGIFGMAASVATGGLMMMDGTIGQVSQSLFPLISMLDVGVLLFSSVAAEAGGAGGAFAGLGSAASGLMGSLGPVGLAIAVIVAAIANLVMMYKKITFFRDAINDLGQSFVELAQTIVGPQVESIRNNMSSIVEVAKSVGNALYKIWELISLGMTIVVKVVTVAIKALTMIIGFITMARIKITEFIQNSEQIQAVFSKIGDVFAQVSAIFSKAFQDAKNQFVTFINDAIELFNKLIEIYNNMAKTMGVPIIVPISYVITGDKSLTSPQVASAVKDAESQQRSKDAEAQRYQAMADAADKPIIEEDLPTGGGGGDKQLTAFQELKKSLIERLKLFTNFGDLMKQYKGKTNAFARALGQATYGGGIADKLRKMNLNESLIADILAQGYDKAKQILGQLQKRKGLAQQMDVASSLGLFAEKMNEIANAGIEAKMQTKAANLARSEGASEDVVKKISEDYDLALRFTKLPANQRKQIIVQIQTTVDQEEALAAAQDPTKVYKDEIDMLRLAQDVATSASKKKIEGLQRELDLVNRQISAIEQLNDKDRQAIRGLERQKEMIERQIEQYERQNELDQRRIDSLKREDELRNRVADAINHDLNILSQQEETIRQQYQQRIDALNEIGQLNDHIVESQKQQLGLAQALSQGDIYAAAAAAQDMQASQGQFAREQQTAALQQGMENQVAGLTTAGGLTRQQAEEQINAIKEQSYQTGLKIQEIEDGIYQRNLLIIPLKESQRDLDIAIRDLNDAIFNRETEILGIQNNKVKPIQEQIQAEQDVLDATNLAFETRIAELDLAIKSNELMQKSIKNADNLALAWHSVATEIANANKVLKQQIEAAGPGPKVTDYASTKEFASAVQAYNSLLDGFKKARDAAVAAAMQRGKNAMASTTLYTGGLVKGYAGGNYVMGNGGRDSVPAMLTPGEFVVRKSMVKKYGLPTFSRMNTGSLPQFDKIQTGSLPRFQLPGTQEISGDIQRQANINLFAPRNDTGYNNISVNVNVPQTNASPDAIANKVAMKIDNINRRGIGNQRVYKQ